ncbi:MAG: MoxR family ATPase [Verrucomicrobiae bacterium]|nr:MoxR family ATPase [Verrucomicrobiae bacterium]
MPLDFSPDLSTPIEIPQQDSWPPTRHRFDPQTVWAVQAAIAAQRPLLLGGESGIGKSQVARAVAQAVRVPFLYHVVDERTERDDLMYSYDAVARLAEAQVSAVTAGRDADGWRARLAEPNFIRPGILWWAFAWADAQRQAETFSRHCRTCEVPAKPDDWSPDAARPCGPVVLVDEIDKADPSVPNGLLEALGGRGFRTAQLDKPVALKPGAPAPLVIITTNRERELPPAFMRRCLVLKMPFPAGREEAEHFLIEERARVFWGPEQINDAVCRIVVDQLLAERTSAARDSLIVPGAAEFLDLIRALVEMYPGDAERQRGALKEIAPFALKKDLSDGV